MNIRYLSGVIISLPLLPLMYYQGKQIRSRVPKLPEAEGIEGTCQSKERTGRMLSVITLGESTIAGVGVKTHEEGFTGTLANELSRLLQQNVSWKVYAKSGYTARKVEQKFLPNIIEKQVDLIVVGLGANDAFSLNRPSKWNTEVRSLIGSLNSKFPDSIIVFCNMPPIKEFPALTPLIKFTVGNLVEILGDELRLIVNDYENAFYFGEKITLDGWIDKFQLKVKKVDFFSDGVHPSKLTYQTWGKEIANEICTHKAIKEALDQKR